MATLTAGGQMLSQSSWAAFGTEMTLEAVLEEELK